MVPRSPAVAAVPITNYFLSVMRQSDANPGQQNLMIAAAIVAGFCLSGAESSKQEDREFQECTECPVMVAIPGRSIHDGKPGQ